MSTKARLISTISAVCLILALLITGVWAVSTANVTLGGKVSFIADNVNATVTGGITGTQETISLPDLEFKANTNTTSTEFQEKLSKWSNNALTFTSTNEIKMTITVKNNSTERSLFVKVTDNTTTTNITKTFASDKTGVKSGQEYELAVNDTITYEIKMSVTELNNSASATYAYDVVLRDSHYTGGDESDQTNISYKYTIEDGEVYKTSYCLDCGVEGVKTKMAEDSYIIATPETAQGILDGDINGKTIIFSKDIYSTDLELRPTSTTAKVYTMNGDRFGEEYTGELVSSTTYGYYREFKNITITAEEGAVFNNLLYMEGGLSSVFNDSKYDAVKGAYANESANFYGKMLIENFTISGLNFEGARGRICIRYGGLESVKQEGLTIENCTLQTDEIENKFADKNTPQYEAGIYLGLSRHSSKNIIVRNNVIDGHYQGVYVYTPGGKVEITNNEISNTSHNAIAVQSNSNTPGLSYVAGDIYIKNNTIENTGDRAIRFGELQNVAVIIENNTFVDAVDSDKDLLKSQVSTGLEYEFKGNTYNGTALTTLSDTTTQLVINLADFGL